jgi:CelD/BcsL family acetyltransferase involved in cellulose biosynthesis
MRKTEVFAVSGLDDLAALEDDWKAVHRADPHATVFTSWPWLWGRLAALTETWWVLVARAEGGPVVGLLPLRTEASILNMAGSPLADYTGFLCVPGYEDAVLAAFAARLQGSLSWRRLELSDVLDSRLDAFLGHFPEPAFRTVRLPPTPCPRLELEDDWEVYLRARVQPRRRQTLRRKLRAIERLPGLRITTVDDGGEAQVATLLGLWQRRWGERTEAALAQFRSVFQCCLKSGCLWLDLVWDGDVPLAGLLAFLDRDRSCFRFYLSGFDERYASWSPGTVIVAHSIREAIRGGFRTYDFLRGDEPYKSSFGARLEHGENVTVVRV